MPKILCVFALESEVGGSYEDELLITGIGQANAAYILTKYLYTTKNRPDLIINLGTAGSATKAPGTMLECREIRNRDNHPLYNTLYKCNPLKTVLQESICWTGDSFVDDIKNCRFDCIDMEAFALAQVCYAEGIQFGCIKYITDNGSETDWRENLPLAARELHAYQHAMRSKWVRIFNNRHRG